MDKHHKKLIKRYISWVMLALFVLALAVMPLFAQQKAEADGPQASILSAKAQSRDIATQIIGGGQLTGESTESVTIPATVKLTEYLVDNGDIVAAGDPVARVDKVSVMLAMVEVQETLDYLAEQIADAKEDTASNTVTAQAGGLVKILYGAPGDAVRDVMLEHGALAVLSLDGRMAVRLDCKTDFTYGSIVQVAFSDGTKAEGKVESASGGQLIVSLKDNGYAIGESVTIQSPDGTALGTGELYIHNPWNATAYYGTISAVYAAEGRTVTAGTTLFQLENSEHTPEFQLLNAQRQEYEELMQELFTMHQSGLITAPQSGFLSGVDMESSFLLSATEEEQGWFFQLLSSADEEEPTESPEAPTDAPEDPTDPDSPDPPTDPDTPEDPTDPDPEDPTEPVDPGTGAYKVRVGQVIAADQGALSLKAYPADISCDSLSEITVDTKLMTSQIARNISGSTVLEMDLATPHGTPIVTGDILLFVTDTAAGTGYIVWAGNQEVSSGNMGGMGNLPGFGGMTGGFGGFGGFGGQTQTQTFTPYPLDTVTVAQVTSQDTMTLEITIDEQDITKLHMQMDASITVEALTGQKFPATISRISNSGINSGGSSKFTVRLTLSRSDDMLPGMHATAYLTLDTARSALTIPVAALNDTGSRVFVYTGYDEKTETFLNPVTVTTGASDGEYVQILSGLAEGDTVFYAYYDTLEISRAPEPAFSF